MDLDPNNPEETMPDAKPTQANAKSVLMNLLSIIPTNWCNPLLTGKDAVIGEPPYNCQDIEQLLLAIRKRLEQRINDIYER